MTIENERRRPKGMEIDIDTADAEPLDVPKSMNTKDAAALNQNNMAAERTEFAKVRTDLALTNTMLAIDRTHLSYLRTIVSLIGAAATLYKALPLLGITQKFTICLTFFLIISSVYFIYKDASTYPKMKRHLRELEERTEKLAMELESKIYKLQKEGDG